MRVLSRFFALVLLPLLWVICSPNAAAQVVTATVTTGSFSEAVAVNTVTNKIYVANFFSSNVTVIDGATNSTITVPAGFHSVALAVNEATNKTYVANEGDCGPFGKCSSSGFVTVIDGATNSTTTVKDPNANGPRAVAVNSATNKIYVANLFSGNVTVIDGATNSTTTVSDPSTAGMESVAVAVNPVTNKIYVTIGTNPGNVTVIDGATNSTTTVNDPNAIWPYAVAVNTATNKIYVANLGALTAASRGNVTVIDGATNSTTTIALDPNTFDALAVAINQTTNKIYVLSALNTALTGKLGGDVTVIDGITNAISTVSDPNAFGPNAVAVDSVTNTVYVANEGCFSDDPCINPGSVTVINGATNSVTTLINPNAGHPNALALDPTTDKIYVAGSKVTVIDGGGTPTTHILSLLMPGNGSGTVISVPAGINCSTSCTASFADGTAVDLTASPSSGVTFSGWSTNCSGTGACNVTMSSDEFVTATFTNNSAPDFSLQSASSSFIVRRGSQVTDIITIAPVGGASFGSAIQLSCGVAVQPPSTDFGPRPTCALSPSSVTPGANSVTSTLTITVPGQSARLIPSSEGQRAGSLYAVFLPIPGLTLIGLSLAIGKPTNRRRQLWLLCSLFIVVGALQVGCGGGSSGQQQQTQPQQTQPQNYTVTVTANSGAIQHTAQITVIVIVP